jgi:hypothetical protein
LEVSEMDDSMWAPSDQTQEYGYTEDASTSTSTETDTLDAEPQWIENPLYEEQEWIENPLYEAPGPDSAASSDVDHYLSPDPAHDDTAGEHDPQ